MADAQLFTLRLWRQQTQFRAALRAVGEERSQFFTEPAAVAEFLSSACGPEPAPPAPAPAAMPPAPAG